MNYLIQMSRRKMNKNVIGINLNFSQLSIVGCMIIKILCTRKHKNPFGPDLINIIKILTSKTGYISFRQNYWRRLFHTTAMSSNSSSSSSVTNLLITPADSSMTTTCFTSALKTNFININKGEGMMTIELHYCHNKTLFAEREWFYILTS